MDRGLLDKRIQKVKLHLSQHRHRYLIYGSTIFIYLIASWLVTLFVDPYRFLTARLVLFILGLIPIAILVRWDDNRIVIVFAAVLFNLLTFAHSLWFPHFYAVLTPVFPIFLEYRRFFPLIAEYNDSGRILLNIARFGYLIDLAIVLLLAGFISLSSREFNRVMRTYGRRRILQVLVVFLMIVTLFVLPYLVIASTGIMQFGLAYGSGAIELQHGVENVVGTGNISSARPYFVAANQQYGLAEDLYKGLKSLSVDDLLRILDPSLGPILSNGEIMIRASFHLTDLFIPLLDGMITVQNSYDAILGQQFQPEVVSQVTPLLVLSRENFVKAQLPLIAALSLMQQVNIQSFNQALIHHGLGNYNKQLNLIKYSGNLFNSTLSLLLLQLFPIEPYSFPIYHSLEAIVNARLAQQQIGNQSRFASVIPTFQEMNSNLTVVNTALNRTEFPEYTNLDQLYLGGIPVLRDLRSQIVGFFNFLRDVVRIGIQLGDFGLNTAQSLQLINSSLVPLTSQAVKIPNIPNSTLFSAIHILDQVRSNATILQSQAASIEQSVADMKNNASQGAYGIFTKEAFEVVDVLQSYQLQTNADNFYHLSSACYYMVYSIYEFQQIHTQVNQIEANVTLIENNPSNQVIVDQSLAAINTTLDESQHSIDLIDANLTLVEYHLNQIKNMPETPYLQHVVDVIQNKLQLLKTPITGNIDQIRQNLKNMTIPVAAQYIQQVRQQLTEMSNYFGQVDQALKGVNIGA